MTRHFIIAAGLMTSAVLHGQTPAGSGAVFQYFTTGPFPATGGPAGAVAGFRVKGIEGMAGGLVTGKPLSATEERHSLQVLGDGTRIENNETDTLYRDDQGRTRIERPDGSAVIQNPVDGFMAELDTKAKTVHKMFFHVSGNNMSFSTGTNADLAKAKMAKETAEFTVRTGVPGAGARETGLAVTGVSAPGISGGGMPGPFMTQDRVIMLERNVKTEPAPNEESLGTQSVNGVTAQGTKTTMTIPTGQIGNDRPIQVVSERWFSTDLQMMVKSSNSDPRLGETTYNLTNINQAAPDPSLFQLPADYSVVQGPVPPPPPPFQQGAPVK
jgi:hypothetical protein